MKTKIKCPKCSYKPLPTDKWICSCNTIWNTFDTAGECPGCKRKWEDTSCPKCNKWSKHLAWYSDLDDKLKSELDAIEAIDVHKIS